MGHVISSEGIRPTAERIKSIQDAPRPVSKQELQSFLRLITYNAKFIPALSHVLQPLNLLLHKNQKMDVEISTAECVRQSKTASL